MRGHSIDALFLDCVVEIKSLVLGTLENERCGNGGLVLKRDGEMLRGVDFGEAHVDDGLLEVHDGAAELGLAREADRSSVLDLDEEVGDGWADLTAAHHNLEVNRIT